MTKLKRRLERLIECENGQDIVVRLMPGGMLMVRPKYGRTGSERAVDLSGVHRGRERGDELGLFRKPEVKVSFEGGAWRDQDGYEWRKVAGYALTNTTEQNNKERNQHNE